MANPNDQFWNAPPAYMGFVGFVRLKAGNIDGNNDGADSVFHNDYLVRVTNADINLSQEITKPDVVDSRYDKTVYQLGPKLIDGSVEFPVVYEIPTGETTTIFELLYRYAVTRQNSGRLSDFNLDVKYATSNSIPFSAADFTYEGCIVNTWKFSVAQSDIVTCSVDLIGVNREPATNLQPPARSDEGEEGACTGSSTTSTDSIGTTRIVTWNDARVELSGGRFSGSIGGQYVRTFEANINNDAERYYTLNTKLFAQSIAPRKRDVDGSLVIMGRNPDLANVALTNQDNCTETGNIKFGYVTKATGEGCPTSSFGVTLPNCVFEIETMSLANELFETTVNFHALPAAGTGVCDPLLSSLGSTTFDYDDNA
jgi:hypothetical protein